MSNSTAMPPFETFTKASPQLLRDYVEGENLSHVSVTEGITPKLGDKIAVASNDPTDMWLIQKEFFDAHYKPYQLPERAEPIHNNEHMNFSKALAYMKDGQVEELKKRLTIEHDDLAVKVSALSNFLNMSAYLELRNIQQQLLNEQLKHMRMYLQILRRRLDDLNGFDTSKEISDE